MLFPEFGVVELRLGQVRQKRRSLAACRFWSFVTTIITSSAARKESRSMAEVQVAEPFDGIKEEQQQPSNGVEGIEQGEAGPSRPRRYRFRPTRHLHEPPQAPPTDHKIEEEAAAQAAAQAAGYEGRRMRRFMQRRTVDYMGTWLRYRDKRVLDRSTARGDYSLKPSPHFVIDVSFDSTEF